MNGIKQVREGKLEQTRKESKLVSSEEINKSRSEEDNLSPKCLAQH